MGKPAFRYLIYSIVILALSGCGVLEQRDATADHDSVKGQRYSVVDDDTVSAATTTPQHQYRPLSVNLHIFGFSYHPDREGTRVDNLDNEINAGLGFGYRLHEDELGIVNSEVGAFKDSGRNWAKFAGVCYLFKIEEHWTLGADFLLIQSPSYQQLSRYSVYGLYFTIPLWK